MSIYFVCYTRWNKRTMAQTIIVILFTLTSLTKIRSHYTAYHTFAPFRILPSRKICQSSMCTFSLNGKGKRSHRRSLLFMWATNTPLHNRLSVNLYILCHLFTAVCTIFVCLAYSPTKFVYTCSCSYTVSSFLCALKCFRGCLYMLQTRKKGKCTHTYRNINMSVHTESWKPPAVKMLYTLTRTRKRLDNKN